MLSKLKISTDGDVVLCFTYWCQAFEVCLELDAERARRYRSGWNRSGGAYLDKVVIETNVSTLFVRHYVHASAARFDRVSEQR